MNGFISNSNVGKRKEAFVEDETEINEFERVFKQSKVTTKDQEQ